MQCTTHTSIQEGPDTQEMLTINKKAMLDTLQSLPCVISFNKQWNRWIHSPSGLLWVLSQRMVHPPTNGGFLLYFTLVRHTLPGAFALAGMFLSMISSWLTA